MAEKARDAFRTISEVANWLDIPAHVLRFWESKFTQIKPVKRAGGRRYYRPDDMRLIGGIKQLLHDDGLTIRGVQKMLKEEGVKHVSDLSPAIDMPSPEEGAARREARRARRQTRQSGKSDGTAPAPVAEDTAEPNLHISDATLENSENVVPIMPEPGHEAADASEPTKADVPDSNTQTSVDDHPTPAEDTAHDQPDFDFDQTQEMAPATPDNVDSPVAKSVHGISTSNATPEAEVEKDPPPIVEQILDEQPAAPEPTPKAAPAVSVPIDPKVADITAREDQLRYAALLRQLRSRSLKAETAPGARAKLSSLMARMEALRDRMADDPSST